MSTPTTCVPDEYTSNLMLEVERLQTENIKMRKLIRMMWLACKSKGIVGGIYEYPNRNSNTVENVRFRLLLRELGIRED